MTVVAEKSKPTEPRADWSRRARRTTRTGTALVARGEAMLWLTGGALAIALAMIGGLLALIVVQGTATFWPAPVVRVQLRDGSARMGEIAREETYTLTEDLVKRLPAETAPAAAALLNDEGTATVHRRLFRTGNFDLTGTHYESVSEFEIEPEGETLPEWAIVIERLEWGRFYGEPVRFSVRHDRTISGEEEQLVRIRNFLSTHRDQIPADAQAAVDAAIEKLAAQLSEMRKTGSALLLENAGTGEDGHTISVLLESGEAVPTDQVPEGAAVTGYREIWSGPERAWKMFGEHHRQVRANAARARRLEKHDIGRINSRVEEVRLAMRAHEIESGMPLVDLANSVRSAEGEVAALETEKDRNLRNARQLERWLGTGPAADAVKQLVETLNAGIQSQEAELQRTLDGLRTKIAAAPPSAQQAVARFFGVSTEAGEQTARIMQELESLRKTNARYELVLRTVQGQEHAVLPAVVVRAYPANQLAWSDKLALYGSRWWEFLSDDPREANSEGGVFPAIWGTVVMTLVMSLAVVPFGVLAALYLSEYAKPGKMVSAVRIAVNNLAGVPSIVFGVFGLGFFCYIIGASIDELFYSTRLPNPTFGKGGLLWASLTLALMTLPVVIVATEEALSAVPKSMREGSYACGASKWQTIRRIVLPRAMPGIMTGMILAMARGAGEVAPLMLVGAVKLAPELPLDTVFPFMHPDRSFMHLGFHIFDLGFQSQNSEAAKPMVFTTTLLLITLVAILNLSAIWLRSRLRKKFLLAQF